MTVRESSHLVYPVSVTSRPLLLTRDVAKLLRVHPKQVYRLLARGLPAHRVGSEWRFVEAEVRAWAGEPVAKDAPAPRTEPAPERPETMALRAGPPPLLAANGDVVVDVLLEALRARGTYLGFVQADATSARSALERREVLFAAYHGGPPPRALADVRLARIHLVTREVGLAAKKAPSSLRALERKHLAGRPPSAGIRGHLDRALADATLTRERLAFAETAYPSHRDAVLAVHRGEADLALTTAAWAERAGLRFLTIAREPYELLLFAEDLGTKAAIATCEVAQTATFRRALARLAGYDASHAGAIRYENGT